MTEEEQYQNCLNVVPKEFIFVGRILKTLVETGNSYPTKFHSKTPFHLEGVP